MSACWLPSASHRAGGGLPPRAEEAREVTKAVLRDVTPRFGVPTSIGSSNGPAFMAEVVQQVAKALNIRWNLQHIDPKVGRMNGTLKQITTKISQEAQLPWVDILPLALLQIRCTPRLNTGYSPFETLPPPPIVKVGSRTPEIGPHLEPHRQLQGLGQVLRESWGWVIELPAH